MKKKVIEPIKMPESYEELVAIIKKEIEDEIVNNLTINSEDESYIYGERDPGSIEILYKGKVISIIYK